MTTEEIAQGLVSLCKEGKFPDALKYYSPDIVSVEATAMPDGSREAKGIKAVEAKGEWWVANHEIHSVTVEGPLVAGSTFCVRFKMDVTFKPTGKRMEMDELAVYHVADGKIDREEFFYGA
ncbi:MAG: nuclear transport factor 2 family protein [Bryobacteraceae bacterium]